MGCILMKIRSYLNDSLKPDDFEICSRVYLKAQIVYGKNKMTLEAIVLICIQQEILYLYMPNGRKNSRLALLFKCNINEMEDVRYNSRIGKWDIFFHAKQSELQIRFRKRKAWKEVKNLIDGGIKIETKCEP